MGWLLEVLSIERGTETEGDTSTELDVVGERSNTLVVDFGLQARLVILRLWDENITYLGERARVELVLGSDLETNVGSSL